jgi:hypothetical protein
MRPLDMLNKVTAIMLALDNGSLHNVILYSREKFNRGHTVKY